MTDNLTRRLLKAIARINYSGVVGAQRLFSRTRGERPYQLAGACRRSAFCCEAPAVQVDRITWYLPLARRAFLWWQRRINGLELTGQIARQRVFVFRCTHFDWKNRSCDSYASRPGMCRDYPRVLLYQASPQFFSGCGYRPLAPNAAALRQALERQNLPVEQREKLVKGLFLER